MSSNITISGMAVLRHLILEINYASVVLNSI